MIRILEGIGGCLYWIYGRKFQTKIIKGMTNHGRANKDVLLHTSQVFQFKTRKRAVAWNLDPVALYYCIM
jgi:hypothetical protein